MWLSPEMSLCCMTRSVGRRLRPISYGGPFPSPSPTWGPIGSGVRAADRQRIGAEPVLALDALLAEPDHDHDAAEERREHPQVVPGRPVSVMEPPHGRGETGQPGDKIEHTTGNAHGPRHVRCDGHQGHE